MYKKRRSKRKGKKRKKRMQMYESIRWDAETCRHISGHVAFKNATMSHGKSTKV